MYFAGVHSSQTSRLYAVPTEPSVKEVVSVDNTTVLLTIDSGTSRFSPILSYTVESNPSIPLTVRQSDGNLLVSGNFQSGLTYTFKVSTSNVYGKSKSSESVTTLPVPLAPPLGNTSLNPAASGADLIARRPGIPSGYYWIKSGSMPNPLRMYVDTTEDGGGYDFYPITGGPSVGFYNETHGGTPLGLNLVYPRSKFHWRAMSNYVSNFRPSGSYADYFQTCYPIYTFSPGNYTGTIMRSTSYGSGSSAHRVPDGGRWWLRDSTFSEPNGDYSAGGFLGIYAAGYSLSEPYNLADIGFNDGGAYYTGNYYLVSTNAKA